MLGKLLILGAGQYSCVVKEIALATSSFSEIAFLDDNANFAIGALDDVAKFKNSFANVAIAIGNPDLRQKLFDAATALGYSLPSLIHPRAIISPSATIKDGAIIEPGAVVQANATIGKGAIISSGAVIRHNGTVGDFAHCDCNCVVLSPSQVPCKSKVDCGKIF